MQLPDLLFKDIKKGSREAFERLFREYYAPLVRFAFWQTGHREAAEDIVAGFFVKLWQKRALLDPVQAPGAYLYMSVKNAVIDYRRTLQNKACATQPDSRDAESIAAPAEDAIENKELTELLEHTVEALPFKRKLIFRLVKEEGLKCREVAELLNLSERTVENQLYRAIEAIARVVQDYLGFDPRKKTGQKGLLFF